MAATFGAPLAAVVLAIELLMFEFSTRALVPLVVAASVAGGVHALLLGRDRCSQFLTTASPVSAACPCSPCSAFSVGSLQSPS